ncbi:hypothetical protein A9X05_01490 [Mycobacterium sp. E3298]|nr:hypothetical protein A9X05_01490 [Mycobacterium sp. E3298]
MLLTAGIGRFLRCFSRRISRDFNRLALKDIAELLILDAQSLIFLDQFLNSEFKRSKFRMEAA